MGKQKKPSKTSKGEGRTRFNYLTGQTETVNGTKAGRHRQLLPLGHPLRTHKDKKGKKD
jgi:hypothetical protein